MLIYFAERNNTMHGICNVKMNLVTRQVSIVEQELFRIITSFFSYRIRVTQSLVFYVVFCTSLFDLFPLTIVLSVLHRLPASDYRFVLSVLLRFTDSDYPFVIFKLFLNLRKMTRYFTVSLCYTHTTVYNVVLVRKD